MATRREFLQRSALTAAALSATSAASTQVAGAPADQTSTLALKPPAKPVIVTRLTGDNSVSEAWSMLDQGQDTLDAVLHVCVGRENDPNDHSVGLGGLPNEEGVVELDSCCMHGPTRMAGSVGGVRNIKNVCLVARKVMQDTAHVMLCGDGAERFAVDEGFPRENLLTDDARKIWLLWKITNSDKDWWGKGPSTPGWRPPASMMPPDSKAPPAASPQSRMIPRNPGPEHAEIIRERGRELYAHAADLGIAPEKRWDAVAEVLFPTTGTIHVSAVNAKGEMSGATTTSGLAWKLPGRLGDSPIIGAGCYTDQEVGSAGATGSGEENIKVVGAHSIVEFMRRGMSPKDAGIATLERIVHNFGGDKLRLRYIDMQYYIVRRDGAFACVTLWSTNSRGKPRQFQVHDGTLRILPMDALYEGSAIDWPPM
jgi:N4-(beta-N-acetylglucosaminyl)-L-asparaginase